MKRIIITTVLLLSIISVYAFNKPNSIANITDTEKTQIKAEPFKLQLGKFYKVKALIVKDTFLPFEAEIVHIKSGNSIQYLTITTGDGAGNADGVDFYEVTRYVETNGWSTYILKDNRGRESGKLSLTYVRKHDMVLVVYDRLRDDGAKLSSNFAMESKAYDTTILNKQ